MPSALVQSVPCFTAALLLAASCAPATLPREPLTPEGVTAAEARLASDPGDLDARLALADAYRRSQRADAAVVLLQPVLETTPAASYFLALVREDQGHYAEARRLYREYLARGSEPSLRRQVLDRLQLLARLELQEAAKYALSREQQLANTAPAPDIVGVFPFLAVSDDPQLRPLGIALAELLTTDLAQTTRLRVVERAQVQALLQEIQLAESGRVDPATAARSGRLLGAGRIVQGRVEGGESALALQAAVLRVPGDTAAANPLQERDALARIFDLEKRLALGIYERLGIQLTAAERQRVMRQPTRDVQALIAFGYGLEAQDAGRYTEAAGHFASAARRDPGFAAATARQEQAQAQANAAATTTATLGQLGFQALDAFRFQEVFRVLEESIPDPEVRDATTEVLDIEGTDRRGTVRIIIRRPGGAS